MDLACSESLVGGTLVLAVSGMVDLSTVPHLSDALARLLVDHPGVVAAVDLDGATSLDDAGLGILLGAAGRARSAGGELAVICSDDGRRRRLAATRFDRAVTVVSSVSEVSAVPR